jgi:hypothetical protein
MEEFQRKNWKIYMIRANTRHGCTGFDRMPGFGSSRFQEGLMAGTTGNGPDSLFWRALGSCVVQFKPGPSWLQFCFVEG